MRALGGDATRAFVAQYLERMRCPVVREPPLDGLQHHVADVRSADAGVHDGSPGDDLPVVRVDHEGAADDVAVPAGELDAVGAPADVQVHRDQLARGVSSGRPVYLRASRRLCACKIRWTRLRLTGAAPRALSCRFRSAAIRR